MTTMKANLQPPPLLLPGSTIPASHEGNEEEEDWGQFEDDAVSISSMSTISTTCEAADDMRMFATTFDQTQTVVVYLMDQHQRDYGTLQPHHGGGVKDLVIDIIDAASGIIDYLEIETKRVTVPTAILLMSNLKEHNHEEDIDQNNIIAPLEKSGNHSNNDFHLLPFVQASDVNKILPPEFLVQPREGFLLSHSYSPAKKRARVTPVSSPTRPTLHDDPELIPSLCVSVPSPIGHQDD